MDDSEEEMLSQLLDLAEDMYKAGAYNSEGIYQVRQIVKNAKSQRRVLSEYLDKEGMTHHVFSIS